MPAEAEPMRRVPATLVSYGKEEPRTGTWSVPVETAVEIAYGGVPFAVMMMTPQDLTDFAYGFSLTEGRTRSAADIRAVSTNPVENGIWIDVTLAPDRMADYLARRRAMTGRTGCGICGIEDLASLHGREQASVSAPSIDPEAIGRAVAGLEGGQILNAATHSVHAAGWADCQGRILHVREDVGRHNALDKLIGCLLRERVDAAEGFIVITSRCSFEMVDKAAGFGAGMLVAVSGPTSLALDNAKRLGMTLIGIARRDGMTVFSGQGALLRPPQAVADEAVGSSPALRPI